MYYTIINVFGQGQSMYQIRDRFKEESGNFKDIDALGMFVDNHDNERFMHSHNNRKGLNNAIIFSMTSRGIPFVYYGSE